MRIAVVSELLSPPFDEGFKKTAHELVTALSGFRDVSAVQAGPKFDPLHTRSGFSWCISAGRKLRQERIDWAIYIPSSSLSFFSMFRARLLTVASHGIPIGVVGLQRRRLTYWQRMLSPLVKPVITFVQTSSERDYLKGLDIQAEIIPSGIDLKVFHPVDDEAKERLRNKYGFPQNKTLVLHVGHLKQARNLESLLPIQAATEYQVVIACSTSTHSDDSLKAKLHNAGVIVLDSLIDQIREIYQACDLYIFPVLDNTSAISFPLSVLEAMACGLPVITTRYGALPDWFNESAALTFWDGKTPPMKTLEQFPSPSSDTEGTIARFSWTEVANQIDSRMATLVTKSKSMGA